MPRYFFHVVDGRFVADDRGTECATPRAVKDMAIRAASEMLRDQGAEVWKTGRWHMFVCDEQNKTQLKLAFEAEDVTGELSGDMFKPNQN